MPTCHTDSGLCQAVTVIAQRHCYLLNILEVASRPASCNCPCQQLAADTVYVLAIVCCHVPAVLRLLTLVPEPLRLR